MIDVENEVIDRVKKALAGAFSEICVTSELGKEPDTYPAIAVVMIDNPTYERTLTLGRRTEHHSAPVFQLDCYSNKAEGRKTECKAIIAMADAAMQNMGFTRFFGPQQIPNMLDASVYRLTARYRGVVSENKFIYRR